MERPKELAGKARFANEAEYEAWAMTNAPNRETETGVGAYNEWWNNRNFVTNLNTSLIVDPPDGRYPPLTPAAEQRRKEILAKANELASWEDYHALVRCIASQTPNGPQAYNSGTYIMQSPGWIAIIRERLDTRLIPLDGRPHVGQTAAGRHVGGECAGRYPVRKLSSGRTFRAGRAESDRVLRHHHRPDDVDQAVDVQPAVGAG